MEAFIKIAQFVLSLSILVILHEMGHFLFARLFKTRVEKFYLFFNPWFSFFKFKKGETEYGMGWLPLGGYVKISGMIDESMDKEQMKKPPQPYEFRSKKTYQRLLIMIGGVSVNFITALIIYILLLYSYGREYIPTNNIQYGVQWDSLALKYDLKDGDNILNIDGEYIENFENITKYMVENNPKYITVERDGEEKQITLPSNFSSEIIEAEAIPIARPILPSIIDSVLKNRPADNIGLKKGDKILSINNEETRYFSDVSRIIGNSSDKTVNILIERKNDTLPFQVHVPKKGLIGIAPVFPEFKRITYTFSQSIPAGISFGVETLVSYVKQMKHVFTKAGVKKIGGFGTIGNLFPPTWDWQQFWNLTALLSIILAFMNILPIPALDGGHVLFLLYEMITGRKPSDKFLEYAQIVGMMLLLLLLLYANGNDVVRWIENKF